MLSIYLYPISDTDKTTEKCTQELARSELQGQSIRQDSEFADKIIEGPQSVHDRIRSWLEESDRIQNETESMVTLVPVNENQTKKSKKDMIRRRKDFSSSGNDIDTPSEIASSEFFDNASIVPLKRAKKDRPSDRPSERSSMEPPIRSSTAKNTRKKIGRTFWNEEEDACLKQGLLNYGPETTNRWATIKSNCFAKTSFQSDAC